MEKAKKKCGRCETCNVGVGTILSVAHNFQAPPLPVAESDEAGVLTVCLPVPVTVCVPIEYLDAHRRRCEVQSVVCGKRQTKKVSCDAVQSRPCLARSCPQASDTRSRRRSPSRTPSREPSTQVMPPYPPCRTRASQVCRTSEQTPSLPPCRTRTSQVCRSSEYTPALPPCRTRTSQVCRTSEYLPPLPPCRTRTSQVCRTSEQTPLPPPYPPRRKKCDSSVSTISEMPPWSPEPEGKKKRERSTSVDLTRLVPHDKGRAEYPPGTGKNKRGSVSSADPPSVIAGKKRRESYTSTGKKKRDSCGSDLPSLDPKRRPSTQQKRKCERKPVKPAEANIPDVPKSCKPRTKHPCIRRPIKKSKDGTGQLDGKPSKSNNLTPSQAEVTRDGSYDMKGKDGKDDKDKKKNGGNKDGKKGGGKKDGGKKNGTKKGEGGGKGGGKGDKRKGSGGKGKGKRKKSKKSVDRENMLLVRCPPAMFDDSKVISAPCQPSPTCCR